MSQWDSGTPQFVFPKPGRALMGVMIGLFAVWLMFAIAVNWGGATVELFLLFCGNTDAILSGEVWRLLTAPFMHYPQGQLGHILFTLLGLYFLTPALEQQWGGPRLLRFLAGSAVIAYGTQVVLELLLPTSVASKLVGEYWFGATPVIEAVAIAWALSFRGQQVRLMFVLPVTSTGLVIFVVALSLLRVIAVSQTPEGLLAPFGGMFAGWLLGGGTPSPLRRLYLKYRLSQMERDMKRERDERRSRAKKAPFDVIEGGRSKGKSGGRKGPDGKWLN